MSGFLARLVGRHVDPSPTLRTRLPSRFEVPRSVSAGDPPDPRLELEESIEVAPAAPEPTDPTAAAGAARSADRRPDGATRPADGRAGVGDDRFASARSTGGTAPRGGAGGTAQPERVPESERPGFQRAHERSASQGAAEAAVERASTIQSALRVPGAATAGAAAHDRPGQPLVRLSSATDHSTAGLPGRIGRAPVDQRPSPGPRPSSAISPRRERPAAARPDVVQVHIGRIEVRAIVDRAAAAAPRQPRSAGPGGPLPLDRYLAGERGR